MLFFLFVFGFVSLMMTVYIGGMFYAASKGWKQLAKRFRFNDELDGTDLGWPDFYIEGSNYKKGVRIHATPRGLQLDVHWIYSIGHPSLLIPWGEIAESTQEHSDKYHYTRLTLGNKEQINIEIPTHIYEKMQGSMLPGGTGISDGLLN